MSAQAIIDELLEYFEDRADASCEPGDDRFRGNKEMSLLQEVQKLAICISEAEKERDRLKEDLSAARQSLYEVAAQRNELHAIVEKQSVRGESQ